MVGGGKVGMEIPVVALASRMTRWAVGGRRSHPFFSFFISRWTATTGRSASSVYSRVATSVRKSVRPRWSCGAGVGGFGRFTSVHCWNQTRSHLSARRESGAARTRGDFTATDCRNAKMSLQSSAMVANVSAAAVSAEACFALPGNFCLSGGRLGRGLLRRACLLRLCIFNRHDAIVIAGLVGLA